MSSVIKNAKIYYITINVYDNNHNLIEIGSIKCVVQKLTCMEYVIKNEFLEKT